jgi:hypothetical protein
MDALLITVGAGVIAALLGAVFAYFAGLRDREGSPSSKFLASTATISAGVTLISAIFAFLTTPEAPRQDTNGAPQLRPSPQQNGLEPDKAGGPKVSQDPSPNRSRALRV